ncbi:unnamed protein product, partial [Prorocentrum cordatum]
MSPQRVPTALLALLLVGGAPRSAAIGVPGVEPAGQQLTSKRVGASYSAVSGSYWGQATGAWGGFTRDKTVYCLAESTTLQLAGDNSWHAMGTTCCDGSGSGSRPGCRTGSYSTAVSHCSAYGLRLCTLSELQGGAGEAHGCSFDDGLVWSSDGCGAATPSPTPYPTPSPTPYPTPGPTPSPTPYPTPSPTPYPTPGPTPSPTLDPTPSPTATVPA